jgi:hypothetical protein
MRPYIQPYLKSTPWVRWYINRMESFETVPKSNTRLTSEGHTITVRFTRVHAWFHTIAIRPIRFKYESYMADTVKYGCKRSHTASYGLTRLQHHHEMYNENHNYLLPPSIARSTQSTCCIVLEWSKEEGSHAQKECKKAHPGPPTTPTLRSCQAWWAGGPTNVHQSDHDF